MVSRNTLSAILSIAVMSLFIGCTHRPVTSPNPPLLPAMTPTGTATFPVSLTPTSTATQPISMTPSPTMTYTISFTPTGSPTQSVSLTPTSTATNPVSFTMTPTSTAPVSLTPTRTGTPTATIACGGTYFGNAAQWTSLDLLDNLGTTRILASRYTLPAEMTANSISCAVVMPAITPAVPPGGEFRMAIYSDTGSGPGTLLAESVPVAFESGQAIYTASLPATPLSPGHYWLAAQGYLNWGAPSYPAQGTLPLGSTTGAAGSGQAFGSTYGPFPATLSSPVTNSSQQFILFVSDCAASTTPTPSPTDTPAGLDISSFVSIGPGTYNYSYLALHPGADMYVNGPVTFNLTSYFSIESSGCTLTSLDFETLGSPAGSSNAGGAHIGAGGADGRGNAGGAAYDSGSNPKYSGSISGSACYTYLTGISGAFLKVNVPSGAATLNGFLNLNGSSSDHFACGVTLWHPTGGAGGGTFVIQADTITGSGTILANGGDGGVCSWDSTYNSGAGGGGAIVLSHHTSDSFTGTTNVSGGIATSPAVSGGDGVFTQTSF